MLLPGDSSQLKRQMYTQSEDTKNDTPNKWQPKESRCSHIHTTQKKIQAMKGHKGGHSIMIKGTTYQENIQLLLYIYLT